MVCNTRIYKKYNYKWDSKYNCKNTDKERVTRCDWEYKLKSE